MGEGEGKDEMEGEEVNFEEKWKKETIYKIFLSRKSKLKSIF